MSNSVVLEGHITINVVVVFFNLPLICQAATEMVQSSQNTEGLEVAVTRDSSLPEEVDKPTEDKE